MSLPDRNVFIMKKPRSVILPSLLLSLIHIYNAHRNLAEQLKEHSIRRRYRAIVAGVLKEDEGTIEGPIGRHPIDRKKMAVNYKTARMLSHIIKFWNVSKMPLMWNAVWKQAERIRRCV